MSKKTTTKMEENKSNNQTPVSFTLTIQPDTIQLFNELQWLKQYAIDLKRATRNDVLKEALDLLAEKYEYPVLMKKYAKRIPENITPQRGRKNK